MTDEKTLCLSGSLQPDGPELGALTTDLGYTGDRWSDAGYCLGVTTREVAGAPRSAHGLEVHLLRGFEHHARDPRPAAPPESPAARFILRGSKAAGAHRPRVASLRWSPGDEDFTDAYTLATLAAWCLGAAIADAGLGRPGIDRAALAMHAARTL